MELSSPPIGTSDDEILCMNIGGAVLFRSRAFMRLVGAVSNNNSNGESLYFLSDGEDREGFRLALQHSARSCTAIQFVCHLIDSNGRRVPRRVMLEPSPAERETICCIFRSIGAQHQEQKQHVEPHLQEQQPQLPPPAAEPAPTKDSPNKRVRAAIEGESLTPALQRWDQLLSTQLTLLNRFFEQAPFPIGLVEVIDNFQDVRYVFANEACSRRFGLTPDRVRSMRASLLLTRDELDEWLAIFRTIIKDMDFRVVNAGTRQTPSGWFETYCSHVRDNYYLFMRKDVTVAKKLEMDLREQSKKLEEAVQAKNRFLAIMSHEIRTPLAGVIGSMCLLGELKLNHESKELVRISQLCGEQALALVDDILDVAKIDEHRNEIVLGRAPFSLHDLLEDAVDIAAIPADEKALELVCDIAAGTPDKVLGDSVRLRQILTNLLANAVKFTHSGSVTVTARPVQLNPNYQTPVAVAAAVVPNTSLIEIAVRDTGIGISPRTQTRLFQPFVQGDDSTSRRYGGSGLGLYIAKRLVALMNGDLKCYSEGDGFGSTFSFVIPIEIDTRSSDKPEPLWLLPQLPGNERQPRTVVVCSSSQQFARVYSEVIWRLGYSVSVQLTMEDAIAAARSAVASNQSPDIAPDQPLVTVLLDAGALEAAVAKISEVPRTAVIRLSSAISPPSSEDQQSPLMRARKPLRRKALATFLEQMFFSTRRMSLAGTVAPQPNARDAALVPHSSIRILVAEDNAMNQAIIRKLLLSLGVHNIVIVPDGAQAVEACRNQMFDIVFMDIMMPVMGGVEATERIRADTTILRQPKIIALTANAFFEEHRRFLRAGMDQVLTKPLRKRELADVFVRFNANAPPSAPAEHDNSSSE